MVDAVGISQAGCLDAECMQHVVDLVEATVVKANRGMAQYSCVSVEVCSRTLDHTVVETGYSIVLQHPTATLAEGMHSNSRDAQRLIENIARTCHQL